MSLGKAEGLSKTCAANFDNLRTVARSSLVKVAGTVAPRRHTEVKRALGYALAWPELLQP